MRNFLPILVLALFPFSESLAAVVTVDVATDSGGTGCELRRAIQSINAGSNQGNCVADVTDAYGTNDTIRFNIPGAGVHTIQPPNELTAVNKPVLIDGYSQPGTQPNTLAQGDDAILLIEIDGSTGTSNNGISLAAGSDGSRIQGLVINRFTGPLIRLASNGNTVVGNFLGTDPTGTMGANGTRIPFGVFVNGTDDNVIGGPDPADRNILSGNFTGVSIVANSDNTVVQGNYIGTDVTGTQNIGNLVDGVDILLDTPFDSLVGGTGPGEGNIIAFNQGNGVGVSNGDGHSILGNSIFSNAGPATLTIGELGIDLNDDDVTGNDPGDGDSGPNGLQNFPELSSAVLDGGTLTVQGNLNSTAGSDFRLELFANDECDPSGNGEGQTFLGAIEPASTDGSGNAAFNGSFPQAGGPFVTATATSLSSGDTSEFSPCLQVTVVEPTPSPTPLPSHIPTANPFLVQGAGCSLRPME